MCGYVRACVCVRVYARVCACLYCALELVRNVQLVRVEQEEDHIRSLRKILRTHASINPSITTSATRDTDLHDGHEIIRSAQLLLFARKDAGRVDQRDPLQKRGVALRRLQPV